MPGPFAEASPSSPTGLTSEEAGRRLARGGPNALLGFVQEYRAERARLVIFVLVACFAAAEGTKHPFFRRLEL